jgi:hypothetical protein
VFGRLEFGLKPIFYPLYPSHKWDGNELEIIRITCISLPLALANGLQTKAHKALAKNPEAERYFVSSERL